jgi:hypothetical protein
MDIVFINAHTHILHIYIYTYTHAHIHTYLRHKRRIGVFAVMRRHAASQQVIPLRERDILVVSHDRRGDEEGENQLVTFEQTAAHILIHEVCNERH